MIKIITDVEISRIIREDNKIIKVHFSLQDIQYFLLLKTNMSEEKVELYSRTKSSNRVDNAELINSTKPGNHIKELQPLDYQAYQDYNNIQGNNNIIEELQSSDYEVYQSTQLRKNLIKQLYEFKFFNVDSNLLKQLDIFSPQGK